MLPRKGPVPSQMVEVGTGGTGEKKETIQENYGCIVNSESGVMGVGSNNTRKSGERKGENLRMGGGTL